MQKILALNRRARFDYDILDTYEAGLSLLGHEVKSAKSGKAGLAGAYAVIRDGEAWLLNCTIPPYQQNNVPDDYDPDRTRRLLLMKHELRELEGKLKEKGLLLIALELFTKGNLVKVKFALARSRKHADRRDVLKKRTMERDAERELDRQDA
jgi:SsrA-binding protein